MYIFKDGEHYSSNNVKEVNEGWRQTSINSNIHNPIITKIQKYLNLIYMLKWYDLWLQYVVIQLLQLSLVIKLNVWFVKCYKYKFRLGLRLGDYYLKVIILKYLTNMTVII